MKISKFHPKGLKHTISLFEMLNPNFFPWVLLLFTTSCATTQSQLEKNNMLYKPGTQFISLNGTILNTEIMGMGEHDIVFLHGFAASIRNWDSLRPLLPDGFRYHFIDLKGHGFSSKSDSDDYSLKSQAALVIEYLQAQCGNHVILVGHSYGGAVALMLLLQNERDLHVEKLVLIDSAGYPQDLPFFVDYLRKPLFKDLLLRILPRRFQVEFSLTQGFFDQQKVTAEIVDRYAYFYDLPGTRRAYAAAADQVVPPNAEKVTQRYAEITIPTLVIWGENDPTIPLEFGLKFHKEIPNSRIVIIPECGHVPQEEKPIEVLNALVGFLTEH